MKSLFEMNAYGDIWQEPDLFDQVLCARCQSAPAIGGDEPERILCAACAASFGALLAAYPEPSPDECPTADDFAHAPGVVMAPIFGLPGPRSSVCLTCGKAIERSSSSERWHTV